MKVLSSFSFKPFPTHSFFNIEFNHGYNKNTDKKNYSSGGGISIFTFLHHCITDIINNGIQIIVWSWFSIKKRIKFAKDLKTADCVYNAD